MEKNEIKKKDDLMNHIINSLYKVSDEEHFKFGIDLIHENGVIQLDNGKKFKIVLQPVDEI